MNKLEKESAGRWWLSLCIMLLGIVLAGCKSTEVSTSGSKQVTEVPALIQETTLVPDQPMPTPSVVKTEALPTLTHPVPTRGPETFVTTTPTPSVVKPKALPTFTHPVSTPVPVTKALPTPIPDDAIQLTTMKAGQPWWSEDGSTLYFAKIERRKPSQTWAINLTTLDVYSASDTLTTYRQAISRTASLMPSNVDYFRVSPSGSKIIFTQQVPPARSTEEACDGRDCTTILANEISWIDVENHKVIPLKMEEELISLLLGFLWSDDENRVLIGVPPWPSGSHTPTIWIADLASGCLNPIMPRDERITPSSISPDGKYILYKFLEPGQHPRFCEMYSWRIDTDEKQLLPDLPCKSHDWLSDNRTIIFYEQRGHRTNFWAYDVFTFERNQIATSALLPDTVLWVVAPDECSLAISRSTTSNSKDPGGVWLVNLKLPRCR